MRIDRAAPSPHASMSLLASKAVRWCGGGWCFFIAENAVMSENRAAVIDAVGEQGYRGCYGALSTASLASIAYGYVRHGPGPRLAAGPPSAVRLAAGLGCHALGFAAAANVAPKLRSPLDPGFLSSCPLDLEHERAAKLRPKDEVRGLQRVTRHPTFWTLGCLGVGAALRTPFAGTAVAALGFPLVAALGGAHMDYRHRRGRGGALSPEKDAATSAVPFVALLSGAQSWAALADELKPVNCAAGAAAAAALALAGLI